MKLGKSDEISMGHATVRLVTCSCLINYSFLPPCMLVDADEVVFLCCRHFEGRDMGLA
jgi:hypothetical protein